MLSPSRSKNPRGGWERTLEISRSLDVQPESHKTAVAKKINLIERLTQLTRHPMFETGVIVRGISSFGKPVY
jgi:hypothetical protein